MEASEGWIGAVEFPATKIDLIDAAADTDAPQETVERLQQLSKERYGSREELEAELAGD
jgi:multidrug resistance efflux pump